MEGARSGRLVVRPDPSIGATAVWLLPVNDAHAKAESTAKAAFLAQAMGTHAADTYHRIVDFMRPRAMAVVDVQLIDHVIVTGTDFLSFAERGLL